mgnify:CR=1 FL=1
MYIFEGRISSSGFASGDRIVIGDWEHSPLGSFTNVMWAKPDGTMITTESKYADVNGISPCCFHVSMDVSL